MARAKGGKAKTPSAGWQRWLPWIINAATLIGLGIAGAKYLSGPKVIEALHKFDYHYALPVLGLSLLYLWLKALRFHVLLRPCAELPLGETTRAYFAGQPATFVPGGVAARAALLKQTGVPASATAVPVVLSSLLDQLMFVVATLIAGLFLANVRQVAIVLLGVLGLVGAVLLIPASRIWLGCRAEGLAKRFHGEDKWKTFTTAFDKTRHWKTLLPAAALSLVSFLTPVLMLGMILAGLDAKVPYPLILVAYTVPSMAARLTPLPGGLGVTEGGMVGMLGAIADVDPNTAAAAAALHRIGDSFFQAVVGALVYFFWWKGKHEAQAKRVNVPRARAKRSRA